MRPAFRSQTERSPLFRSVRGSTGRPNRRNGSERGDQLSTNGSGRPGAGASSTHPVSISARNRVCGSIGIRKRKKEKPALTEVTIKKNRIIPYPDSANVENPERNIDLGMCSLRVRLVLGLMLLRCAWKNGSANDLEPCFWPVSPPCPSSPMPFPCPSMPRMSLLQKGHQLFSVMLHQQKANGRMRLTPSRNR